VTAALVGKEQSKYNKCKQQRKSILIFSDIASNNQRQE
jgi:hypothetical protein